MCAAAIASGRAACTWLWMANAAGFTGQVPSTTDPAWSTRMRSLTLMRLKCMANGFTQNVSGNSGSRAVMCPATPSSNPALLNNRNAAASRCLRCRRSASTESNVGGIRYFGPSAGCGMLLGRTDPVLGSTVWVMGLLPRGRPGCQPAGR